MDDIYHKLSKHFLGEASPDEELDVARFKKENKKEYQILALLWKKRGISVKDFDSHKAWKTVTASQETRVIPLYSYFKRIAAAAVLVAGMFALYQYYGPGSLTVETISLINQDERIKLIHLADGSKVWLNKNATLVYSSQFTGTERKVSLTGEAFFEVTQDKEKPFVISTKYSDVTVLGTSFNVIAEALKTEVSVTTGKVKVSSLTKPNSIIIEPGYSASCTSESLTSSATKNSNYASWKTGAFVFDNTPLNQVIADLRTYYPEQIVITYPGKDTCKLKARFNQARLSEIIEVINLTCDVDIKVFPEPVN